MKKYQFLILIPFLLFLSISCEEDNNENVNFFNENHRIGLWINPTTKDTLDFLSNNNLIRKGKIYVYEKYQYRIESNVLYLKNPDFLNETGHKITIIDTDKITLGNMLFTTGFQDDSSTYIKVEK